MFEKAKEALNSVGLPVTDNRNDIQAKEFSAGGHYGLEISSMNNFSIIEKALKLSDDYDLNVTRFIECRGIMRLPDEEIRDMAQICQDRKKGLVMSIGPRASNDIGAFSYSENGKRVGYRNRGIDGLTYALEEVYRGVELGITGFLIYDEGLLYVLNKMRNDGRIPQYVQFKYSVHASCCNPASAKLLTENGCDTINLTPSMSIDMIASFRKAVSIPFDVFSDTAKAAGGFIRTYEIPEIIRVAAPLFIKCGPVSQPTQNHLPSDVELLERIKQTRNVYEHINRYYPEAKLVNVNEPSICIPNYR
ncbi:hypothetical protein AWY96_01350 [Serratia plymuthica]|uniref:U32 family peptidase n=1 Tax=Serratia plymuthica TaxID=82996 RepID=UPI0007A07A45|nr:U32 family peptidase [Serratia plymuthica]KYQ97216.1 hypothetical protein AWY96_01350 [Serratia plymuthica]